MQKSNFEKEKELLAKGFEFVIGIDEAGRGPLAGPVVACATTVRNFQFPISNFQSISNDKNWDLIRDSKTLSAKQREKAFDFVQENFHVGIGICNHEAIDRMNILEATYLAAKTALSDLMRKINQDTKNNNQTNPNYKLQISNKILNLKFQNNKAIILFDGNKLIPNLSFEQRAIIGGDKIVKSISAASIIAKVTRDRIMLEMHEIYPEYDFDKHKGYGTKLHMSKIHKYGPCPIHRKSFEPMKSMLKK